MITLADFENYIQRETDLKLDETLIKLLFENFFSNLKPSPHPELIVLGGSPGAGKTHYRRKFLNPSNFHIHDMDEVLIRLPDYQRDSEQFGKKIAFERWWPTAQKISNVMVRFAFRHHYNVIYDRTCGTEESFLDLKAIHARKKYHIVMYGFWVSEGIALARIKEREKHENRTVTPEITKEYLRRFSALWQNYIAITNEAYLLDNNPDAEYRKIYEKIGSVERTFNLDHYMRFLISGWELNFSEKFPGVKRINRFSHFSRPSDLSDKNTKKSMQDATKMIMPLTKSRL